MNCPIFTGHQSAIMDLHFSPFNQECIASASDDTTVKIWTIPPEMNSDIEEAQMTLSGHTKKVILVRWNPVANNVLGSVSYDNTIKLWDVESGAERSSFNDHPETIHSFDWSYNGSKYLTYCKDKMIRMVDPRNNRLAGSFSGHQGTKGARVTFLGDRQMFATIGFSKTSERQIFFWDERDTSKTLQEVQVDIASGTLIPFFDADTNILYVAGKGDTNIRYFEIDDSEPYHYFISAYSGKDQQRGLATVPKRGLDVAGCEIARFLRLTQNSVEPVSFSVPRKGDQFQDDLYPPSFSGRPSLTNAEWFRGGIANPQLMSLRPGAEQVLRPVVKTSQSVDSAPSASSSNHLPPVSSTGPAPAMAGGGGGVDAATAAAATAAAATARAAQERAERRVAELEEENRRLRAAADEAARLRQANTELEAKAQMLEARLAKMG
jgi:WD40 repeat protein